jgi:hypothetical protein
MEVLIIVTDETTGSKDAVQARKVLGAGIPWYVPVDKAADGIARMIELADIEKVFNKLEQEGYLNLKSGETESLKCPTCKKEPDAGSYIAKEKDGYAEVHCQCGEVYSYQKSIKTTYLVSTL